MCVCERGGCVCEGRGVCECGASSPETLYRPMKSCCARTCLDARMHQLRSSERVQHFSSPLSYAHLRQVGLGQIDGDLQIDLVRLERLYQLPGPVPNHATTELQS